MSRISAVVVAAAVCAGVVAGCSGAPAEPVGLTGSPTADQPPTSTPSPTPAPSEGTQDLSDPDLGIKFEGVPALDGDDADVYNWVATFERESWGTITTSTVSPAFSIMASTDVQANVQSAVAENVKDGNVFGGVLHDTVGDISVAGDTARGTACRDYREVTFTDAQRSYTRDEAGFGESRLMELKLSRVSSEDRWIVTSLGRIGAC